MLARAEEGAVAATLIDVLTVGPNTRLAFRPDEGSGASGEIEVELSRDEYAALRDSGVLRAGERAYLKPRRVTEFDPLALATLIRSLRVARRWTTRDLARAASLSQAMAANARQHPEKVFEIQRVLEDGDLVAVHSHVRQQPGDRGQPRGARGVARGPVLVPVADHRRLPASGGGDDPRRLRRRRIHVCG